MELDVFSLLFICIILFDFTSSCYVCFVYYLLWIIVQIYIKTLRFLIDHYDNADDDDDICNIQVIDVNDNRPTFPPYAVVTVDESAEPGSLVTSVTANDIDTNPALIYDFTQGSDGAGVFAIDRFTGRVVLAQRLDREVGSNLNRVLFYLHLTP